VQTKVIPFWASGIRQRYEYQKNEEIYYTKVSHHHHQHRHRQQLSSNRHILTFVPALIDAVVIGRETTSCNIPYRQQQQQQQQQQQEQQQHS